MKLKMSILTPNLIRVYQPHASQPNWRDIFHTNVPLIRSQRDTEGRELVCGSVV